MLKRTDNALPPFNQATRKPNRREQRKLDQQIAAQREARRLEKHRARQKRYRVHMKAKAKTKPKLTMAALAKVVGVSRWTLQRLGLRAAQFRRVKLEAAQLSRGVAIKVVQRGLRDTWSKPLKPL